MDKAAKLGSPCEIQGIQMELGIQNIGGQLSVYQNLLRTFYKEASNLLGDITSLWLNDKELFRIKVHGLKGSASYIAAYQLVESASKMEAAAKCLDTAYIEGHLDNFIEQIKTQIRHIKSYLDTLPKAGELSFPKESKVSTILAQKLYDAIDEMDLDESWKYIREIGTRHGGKATKEILLKLDRLLDNLDYEEAIHIVEENWLK